MAKDRQHIGGRYVELFRVNRGEMLAALEQFVGGYMSNQMAIGPGANMQAYGNMYGNMQSPYAHAQQAYMAGPGMATSGPGAYNMQQQMVPGGMAGMQGMGMGGQRMQPGTLRMRGIPFRSTVDDVLRFFTGFQVVPGGVVLGQRDGRATGECSVTFTTPAEAQRAMVMNNKHMGTRYVELFSA